MTGHDALCQSTHGGDQIKGLRGAQPDVVAVTTSFGEDLADNVVGLVHDVDWSRTANVVHELVEGDFDRLLLLTTGPGSLCLGRSIGGCCISICIGIRLGLGRSGRSGRRVLGSGA